MIEHLMSSSLSGDHQGCAAWFIRLHVRALRSHQSLIARVVVCATGAVHTDIFRSIRAVLQFTWSFKLSAGWPFLKEKATQPLRFPSTPTGERYALRQE
jgi:hypothetical protein